MPGGKRERRVEMAVRAATVVPVGESRSVDEKSRMRKRPVEGKSVGGVLVLVIEM